MDDEEIDRIATRVIQKLMEPPLRDRLVEAVAEQLRSQTTRYERDMARLGQRLDHKQF